MLYFFLVSFTEIDLKMAAKFFGTKFACGASVTGDDEIVIQGDVKDDLFDLLPEKWSQIDEDSIDDLGEQKRWKNLFELNDYVRACTQYNSQCAVAFKK